MFDRAPRRPALWPCLLFLAASMAVQFAEPALALFPVGVLLLERLRDGHRWRRFDLLLLCLGLGCGVAAGWQARGEPWRILGDAALAIPIDRPVEGSWSGTLTVPPRPIDETRWLLRLDARPEPAATSTRSLDLAFEVQADDRVSATALTLLRPGQRVRVWARVHLRDAQGLAGGGPAGRGTIKSSHLVESLPGGQIPQTRGMRVWRDSLYRRLSRLCGSDTRTRDFLAALLLGERTARQPELQQRLRASGLSHMLAISGLHVGLIAWVVLGFVARTRRRPFLVTLLAVATLVLFGSLVGAGTPVQRAVGGILLVLAGRTLGRDGDTLNRLACVAIAIGAMSPSVIATPAFALSFAATTGILLGATGVQTTSRPVLALRVSTAAYVATAPLCAAEFGQLAPWAPLSNVVALPFLPWVLGAGYASLALANVAFLGPAAIATARFGFGCIEAIATVVDRLPLSPRFVAEPSRDVLLAIAVTATIGWFTRPGRLRGFARLVFALSIGWLHIGPPPARIDAPAAELFDVGQGQALLWQERGETTLVDAAGRGWGDWDPGATILRPALLRRGITRLDRLVVSHGHADHAAGAFALLESIEVGELWLAPGWWRNARLSELAAAARARGSAIRLVVAGESSAGIRVHAPVRGPAVDAAHNANSIVVTLGRSPWTIFVPGDLDGTALDALLADSPLPHVSALVLPHHGSRRGRTEILLDRLRPDTVLVSCGWHNRFGHPHPNAVERVERYGLPLWRTDHHGNVRLNAVPGGWHVEVERNRPSRENAPATR